MGEDTLFSAIRFMNAAEIPSSPGSDAISRQYRCNNLGNSQPCCSQNDEAIPLSSASSFMRLNDAQELVSSLGKGLCGYVSIVVSNALVREGLFMLQCRRHPTQKDTLPRNTSVLYIHAIANTGSLPF